MELKTQKDKVSYILGEDIGKSIVSQGYDLNVDILVETIKEQRAVLDKVDYLKSIKKLSQATYIDTNDKNTDE